MAVLHDAAIFFFGVGWINLGDLEASVGYPVFMSFAIIVGGVHGFRTGEWKGRCKPPERRLDCRRHRHSDCLLAQGKSMMPR
jgi:hypothetical protein